MMRCLKCGSEIVRGENHRCDSSYTYFKRDNDFGNKPEILRGWESYFLSDLFYDDFLKNYSKRPPTVTGFDRIMTEREQLDGFDIRLYLSDGGRMLIDHKTDRFRTGQWGDTKNIALEVVSNAQERKQGWMYHQNAIIAYGYSNDDRSDIIHEGDARPLVFQPNLDLRERIKPHIRKIRPTVPTLVNLVTKYNSVCWYVTRLNMRRVSNLPIILADYCGEPDTTYDEVIDDLPPEVVGQLHSPPDKL